MTSGRANKVMNAEERHFRLAVYGTAGLQGFFNADLCLWSTPSSRLPIFCLLGYKLLMPMVQIEEKIQHKKQVNRLPQG